VSIHSIEKTVAWPVGLLFTKAKGAHSAMKTCLVLIGIASGLWRRLRVVFLRRAFARHGRNFHFDPNGTYSFHTITVGDDVDLGLRPTLMATRGQIRIGNHVMFGPEVTIRGGNHRIDLVGRYMKSVTDAEKRPEDDRGVVIEDDVWIGTRAIILHGTTISRGAVVGAGAVVGRFVPPYAVVCGAPARVVRFRWDVNTILAHEKALYPPNDRLTREALEKARTTSKLKEVGQRGDQ